MNSELNNPYAAPQTELQPRRSLRQTLVNGAAWSWLLIFVINLPFALAFGWQLCSPAGRWGMLATLALMFAFSTWLVSSNPWYRVRMIIGGTLVAVTQFIPILQMLTGAIGMSLVEVLGLMPRRPPVDDVVFVPQQKMNLPSAIFLTLFVGGVLLIVALLIGSLFRPKDERVFAEEELGSEQSQPPEPLTPTRHNESL